jgi:hypothetical protein
MPEKETGSKLDKTLTANHPTTVLDFELMRAHIKLINLGQYAVVILRSVTNYYRYDHAA